MKKQKTKKDIRKILIPVISGAVAIGVLTPWIYFCTKTYTRLYNESDMNRKSEATTLEYRLMVDDTKIADGCLLEAKTSPHAYGIYVCKAEVTRQPEPVEGQEWNYLVGISFSHLNDTDPIQKNEQAFFDLTFTLKDKDGNQIWIDTVKYLTYRYTGA